MTRSNAVSPGPCTFRYGWARIRGASATAARQRTSRVGCRVSRRNGEVERLRFMQAGGPMGGVSFPKAHADAYPQKSQAQ